MQIWREKQLLQSPQLLPSFLPYVTLLSYSVFMSFLCMFPCCHASSHLWPKKQVPKMTDLGVLLHMSKMLNFWLMAPNSIVEPKSISLLPSPCHCRSLNWAWEISARGCKFAELHFSGHTAAWQFAEQEPSGAPSCFAARFFGQQLE